MMSLQLKCLHSHYVINSDRGCGVTMLKICNGVVRNNRAIYTSENKPRLKLATT